MTVVPENISFCLQSIIAFHCNNSFSHWILFLLFWILFFRLHFSELLTTLEPCDCNQHITTEAVYLDDVYFVWLMYLLIEIRLSVKISKIPSSIKEYLTFQKFPVHFYLSMQMATSVSEELVSHRKNNKSLVQFC